MALNSTRGITGPARAGTCVGLLAGLLAASAGSVLAQVPGGGAATRGSSGVHFLLGGFVGRFDLDGGGQTDLFGGRAGVGLGELVQVTGFYWRGFDRSADSIIADNAWGGELQLNLNTGFGVAPFITGGLARVHPNEIADQTAAIAGAGLTFPIGPVLLNAAARDYMFGVTGLENDDSPESVTHNWLYSAGFKIALGSRRRRSAVAAAPPPPDQSALRAANAELAALRDSLLAAGTSPAAATAMVERAAANRPTPSNYQSDRHIQIPIPTEGSITLRYGPEPPAAAAPIVVAGAAGSASETAGVSPGPVPAPPVGAVTLDDPATRAWLEQVVAQQVALELARRPTAGPALTQSQLDALAQRVLDGVVASVVPQLDQAQARRMNDLRDDLRVALRGERADVLRDLARPEPVAAAPPSIDQPPVPAPGRDAPADAPGGVADPTSDQRARSAELAAAARNEAAQRTALAAIAAAHPRFVTTAETPRGPAAVLSDAVFESGAALPGGSARPVIAAVAELLRLHPDRRIYIHGHTDAVGTELHNQNLSELRAEAVRSLLVQEGMEADRLFAIGYGQGRPVADNATDRGRALNRRVEIVIGESRSVAAR
jgi:outer membrane protein OmpA-like peptidoglycan-associated protein